MNIQEPGTPSSIISEKFPELPPQPKFKIGEFIEIKQVLFKVQKMVKRRLVLKACTQIEVNKVRAFMEAQRQQQIKDMKKIEEGKKENV